MVGDVVSRVMEGEGGEGPGYKGRNILCLETFFMSLFKNQNYFISDN